MIADTTDIIKALCDGLRDSFPGANISHTISAINLRMVDCNLTARHAQVTISDGRLIVHCKIDIGYKSNGWTYWSYDLTEPRTLDTVLATLESYFAGDINMENHENYG